MYKSDYKKLIVNNNKKTSMLYIITYLLSLFKPERVEQTQNLSIIDEMNRNEMNHMLNYWRWIDKVPYVLIDTSKKYTNEQLNQKYLFVVGNIPDDFFHNCFNIEKVVIHKTDQRCSIGERAFKNCYKLFMIHIPPNVDSIGESCFMNCIELTKVMLPDKVVEIKESTFDGCTNLNKIKFSKDLFIIGFDAFRKCNKLDIVYNKGTVVEVSPNIYCEMD